MNLSEFEESNLLILSQKQFEKSNPLSLSKYWSLENKGLVRSLYVEKWKSNVWELTDNGEFEVQKIKQKLSSSKEQSNIVHKSKVREFLSDFLSRLNKKEKEFVLYALKPEERKVLKVYLSSCFDCPYFREGRCEHFSTKTFSRKQKTYSGRKIPKDPNKSFPSWCPLPNSLE